MLARDRRVTEPAEMRTIMRKGRVSRTPSFVTYTLKAEGASRATVIVGKTVDKSAVERNRIKRAAREEIRSFIEKNPNGYLVVVRALPAAGSDAHNIAFTR